MKKLSHLFAVTALCVGPSAFAAELPGAGICGFSMGANYPFISSQNKGDVTLNLMGTINFGTRTIKFNENTQIFDSSKTDETRFVNTQNVYSVTYATPTASNDIPGMHTITLNANNKINLMPVNNGKTVLMQWFNATDSHGSLGVCQF